MHAMYENITEILLMCVAHYCTILMDVHTTPNSTQTTLTTLNPSSSTSLSVVLGAPRILHTP